MTNLEKYCIQIEKLLRENGIRDKYSLFTRPRNHLIIETWRENREEILEILKTKYDVITNDEWCCGVRLGIIIPNMFERISEE